MSVTLDVEEDFADIGFYTVPAERIEEVNAKVGSVYLHTAAAFGATCVTAWASAQLGLATKVVTLLSALNPLATIAGITAITIALIVKTVRTPIENTTEKQNWFGAFSVWEGLVLSPLVLINAPACAFAAAATVGVTGALGFASMKMQTQLEKYEKILFVALGALAVCSLGAVVFGGSIVGTVAGEISLFGGLAAFSVYVIYDTQEVRKAALENKQFSPVDHSIGLYLDVLNLAIRLFRLYDRYVR